jgi:nucleoside 2-deoxyribosyltransferase
MNIYLAASFKLKDELREYAKELRRLGHEVTSRWLRERAHPKTQMKPTDDYGEHALRDLEDIDRSDLFVIFNVDPRKNIKRGGKHFEAGYAYASRIPIIVIGPNENIFYCLRTITKYKSWEDFIGDRSEWNWEEPARREA